MPLAARYLLPPYGDGQTVAPGSTVFNGAGCDRTTAARRVSVHTSVRRTADGIGAANAVVRVDGAPSGLASRPATIRFVDAGVAL